MFNSIKVFIATMEHSTRKKIIEFFIRKKQLITLDQLKLLESENLTSENSLEEFFIKTFSKHKISPSSHSLNNVNPNNFISNNPTSLSSLATSTSNHFNNNIHHLTSTNSQQAISIIQKPISTFSIETSSLQELNTNIEIKFSYVDIPKKREPSDFAQLFKNRFAALERILRNRRELQSVTSINRILSKTSKEEVSIIGLVLDVQKTKNNNIVLLLEDPTSQIKVIINKTKPALYALTSEIVHDEVIGIVGTYTEGVVFATSIFFPDIPLNTELKKSPDECYAAFISDIHIGSNNFMEEEFSKFISWLNLEYGSEQHREIAKKLGYLIIAGDLIDGVGIYPNQESELQIKDVIEQYNMLASYLSKIPKHIKIILSPGNHDAIRISEPQPPPYKDFAAALYSLPNIYILSNPSLINIHKSKDFSGFDILIYHGYSFDYYIANVDELRLKGGYKKGENIMKFLLKKRHLAPTHSSTLYIPDVERDPLVIETVPDFFITGHTHYTVASNYKNITLISGSCWQSITSFQEKMGHEPQPCRVPIVNLNTRAVKILNFSKE